MLTYAFIPFAIMLVCSCVIISKLYRSQGAATTAVKKSIVSGRVRQQKNIDALSQQSTSSKKTTSKQSHYSRSISKQTQISSILLTTNFLFVFLVSPLLILNALNMLKENSLTTTLVYFLSYANHGLNFIFYGISCQKYRKEFIDLVKCCCCCFCLVPSHASSAPTASTGSLVASLVCLFCFLIGLGVFTHLLFVLSS